MRWFLKTAQGLAVILFLLSRQAAAADVWSSPAFSVAPAELRQSAEPIKGEKDRFATLLLNEVRFDLDKEGRMTRTVRLIYRVENQQGVDAWSETSGVWDTWHQSKPELKSRVITADGVEHWLDPKTLNDVPVHQSSPDIYSDERRFGGPLPAVAPGAIVEEQVVVRDTAPLFAAGTVYQWGLAWSVPVAKTHFVVSYPESLPVQYRVHLLPDANVEKSRENGQVTITLDQGPLPSYTKRWDFAPSDVFAYPEFDFSTGTSWKQVAEQYDELSAPKMRASDVQSLISTIDTKSGSRDEIIRRIVAALHKNVRYTGVEFGESSLIPQPPSETLERKYGDCKDKATLLATMLRAVGIQADLALLDVGPGQDVDRDLPGMGRFNHAIVYVPASRADAALWIDATAQYTQVGTLPWMDYGRWALVVDGKTEGPIKTPELTVAQNEHHEVREFALAEHGMATITETDLNIGPGDGYLREYYSRENKDLREENESYVKSAYLAESLTSFDHSNFSDMEKPATVKFVAKGRRGNTDLDTAVAAIRLEGLYDNLPRFFRTKKKAKPDDEDDEDDSGKDRKIDWQIDPFATEWDYTVTAPLGFKLRGLPSDKEEKVGTLKFTQKYSANPEGTVVHATLRVEDSTARMTVEQANDLRDAVVKARAEDPVVITFENEGYTLIAAGNIKEGLERYEQVAAEHPSEALHKVQLAQALVDAGLGEEARKVAQEATTLDPKSALAFSTLGGILRCDLIGRPIKKGMDLDGAAAAFRKAVELDPKDKDSLANLGLLLEHDSNGVRYSEKAKLKEAVAALRDLRKLDEDYAKRYDDNILFDLWYAHDYQGLLDEAKALPTDDTRRGLMLAAIAVQQSVDAALKKSLEITTDNDSRRKCLLTAGAVLVRVRKYQEGAAMLAEGARGEENESQIVRSVAIFRQTKPYEEVMLSPSDPRSIVQQIFGRMLSGNLTYQEAKGMAYSDPLEVTDEDEAKEFDYQLSTLRAQLENADLPLATIADMAISNMKFTVEGDDTKGYKIIVETPGSKAHNVYVVRQEGKYKIASFSVSESVEPEGLASLALQAVDRNDLEVASTWLDRAREEIHISNGDDPLEGGIFPHFWEVGKKTDLAAARTAALTLLPSKELKGPYLAAMVRAHDEAKTDIDRARLAIVLAQAYASQDRRKEELPVVRELVKAYPNSILAANLASFDFGDLKLFDEWDAMLKARMSEHPDEMEYVRMAARLAEYRGDFRKAQEILKTIIDKGRATSGDYNQYAWEALFLPEPIGQDTIDMAQRGSDLRNGGSFSILHTLACLDAQAGRTSQARELLLKAMNAGKLEEPNEEVWFGFALIAEKYGVVDSAEKMFKRMEKPKTHFPGETYALAQQHLAALAKLSGAAAKSAKR